MHNYNIQRFIAAHRRFFHVTSAYKEDTIEHLDHLDKEAIALARENYKKKMNKPYISDEVDQMTDEQFLPKKEILGNCCGISCRK